FAEATGFSGRQLEGPPLLLTWYDLGHIEWLAAFLAVRRPWVIPPEVIEQAYGCAAEIASGLTPALARPWWRARRAAEEEFESGRLRFPEGVALVKDWTRLLRRFLRGLGKYHLLPAPEGRFPSPRACAGSAPNDLPSASGPRSLPSPRADLPGEDLGWEK